MLWQYYQAVYEQMVITLDHKG